MLKLIATDMDGTFLKNDQTYDETHFAKVYTRLQQQQIRFVVASGNQYAQLKSFFQAYPETLYIADNGAYIRNHQQVYAVHSFSDQVYQQILAKIQPLSDIKILISAVDGAYVLTTEDPDQVAKMRHYYFVLDQIENLAAVKAVMKISITCPPAKTEAIVAQLRNLLDGLAEVTSSGHGDIDIIQPGRNKAAGLQELGAILNIDLPEMMAFGDGGNDLEMLREVGLGVAMANAQPAVMAVANAQTSSNEAQGVLSFIDQYLVQ